MSSNIAVRSDCRLCLHSKLTKVFDLPLTPPGEQLKLTIDEKDPDLVPIDLYQCEKCGHVQVVHVPAAHTLFGSQYTFITRDNPLLIRHIESSVGYFIDNYSSEINFVLEVGSNDGIFLETMRNKTNCKVLGVDPSIEPVKIARRHEVDTILDFFTPKLAKNIIDNYGYPDLVVANNVFAHMDDLRSVMSGISLLLQDNSYFMFEVSYLKDVVEKYLIGTIIHEHLSVHSVHSMIPFLNEFGFNLIGIKYIENVQGGALVGVAQKNKIVHTPDNVLKFVKSEHKSGITNVKGMQNFNKKFHKNIDSFKKLINSKINKSRIIGFGAARSAPLIIDLLDIRESVDYIIEESQLKIGKYMPIGNIPIVSINSHINNSTDNQIYVILGWAQTERIVEKILSITKHCLIITIYPKFEIRAY
jgi:hypothetical protein